MSNGKFDEDDVIRDLYATGEGLRELEQRGILEEALKRVTADDLDGLGELLASRGDVLPGCELVCRYFCTLRCQIVCLQMLGAPQATDDPGLAGLQKFAKAVARIGADDEILVPLVRAVEGRDAGTFRELLEKHDLHPWGHLLCTWICSLDCRLHCDLVCFRERRQEGGDLLAEVRAAAAGLAELAGNRAGLKELLAASAEGDGERARSLIAELDLLRFCHLICWFFCLWRCYWICLRLCRDFPLTALRNPVPALHELSKHLAELAERGAFERLHEAVVAGDPKRFAGVLEELGLTRFCSWICLWVCRLRCSRFCFWVCRPDCEILEPDGCVEEQTFPRLLIFKGIEIVGTAAGPSCGHYTLEWREAGAGAWRSDGVQYPGGTAQGTCGVVNGVLGWIATYPAAEPGPVELRLCLHPEDEKAAPSCCVHTFELQRRLVWIRGLEGIDAEEPPGVLDPSARLVDGSGDVRSFGTALRVFGTAWLDGCDTGKLKRYTLSFHEGFVNNPAAPGFIQCWQVDFDQNAFQAAYRDNNPIDEEALTSVWRRQRICLPPLFPPGCFTIGNYLLANRWDTRDPVLHHVEPVDPPGTPSPATWTSNPVALANCQSGRYTLRLTAEDTSSNLFHDLQHVWIDNKPLGPGHAKVSQIAGIPPCEVVNLSQFAVDGGDCGQPWPAQVLGVAFDDYIEEGNVARPSDNFGGYRVWVKKDGAANPGTSVPIPGPGGPPWGGPFVGTSRVGVPAPADRCPNPVPNPGPYPPGADGILALLDMRRFDAVCNPAEPGLTLERGECCDYVLRLEVWDETICPQLTNHRHQWPHTYPFRLCNDLG